MLQKMRTACTVIMAREYKNLRKRTNISVGIKV